MLHVTIVFRDMPHGLAASITSVTTESLLLMDQWFDRDLHLAFPGIVSSIHSSAYVHAH